MIKLKHILLDQYDNWKPWDFTYKTSLPAEMTAKIQKLSPNIQSKAKELCKAWLKDGYDFYIRHSIRTWEDQDKAYNRGTAKIKGGSGVHEYGRAMDIRLLKGNPSFDPDLDEDGTPTTWSKEVGGSDAPTPEMLNIAKNLGWESGGLDWGWDWYHIQYTDEFTNKKGGDKEFICKYGKEEIKKVQPENLEKYNNYIKSKCKET